MFLTISKIYVRDHISTNKLFGPSFTEHQHCFACAEAIGDRKQNESRCVHMTRVACQHSLLQIVSCLRPFLLYSISKKFKMGMLRFCSTPRN